MASIKFNPFTNKFDYVGSGSGVSYIDGEVADSSLLPVTLGSPAIGDVYLAKAGSGVWLINRRPAGLYRRSANNGNLDDWTYLSAFPEVQADSRFRIYNATDATKEIAFDASAIAAGTTRTITVPDKNVTLGVNADWNAASGDAQILNKPSTFAPSAHANSHAAGGSDPLAPSDIGAQSIFSVQSLVITTTAQVTLTAARAKIYDIVQYAGAQVDVKLPSTNAIEGDIVVMRWGTGGDSIRVIQSSSGAPITTVSSGEQKRFIRGSTDSWSLVPVDTHSHELTALAATGATNGHVLTANGSGGVAFAAASGGGSTDFSDSSFRVSDNTDSSKKVALECSGVSASTTRTLTVANRSGTVVVSDTSAGSGSDVVNNIVSLTQAEYDAIGSKDASTLYIITDP